mmetsp:Transcript_1506/g.4144  ORF Transcript_1506/g.4144 Transcript_1506/m.4144 type:complete len:163 (-) Transcript_1506:750-1238(-)|eukprot:CAMPEP_0198121194 /NCGR_PEP_ID=MMETSP1442-20131203/31414_1 /TAXON_ID= /ORGANISM="Craspedostauros australis, Strain CCMP3328" /LENGTH=162 /DNA_ID=CAMNT_0043779965 /DNA_START=95 /DNA_END=583 /DNA_ORIENTATION=+
MVISDSSFATDESGVSSTINIDIDVNHLSGRTITILVLILLLTPFLLLVFVHIARRCCCPNGLCCNRSQEPPRERTNTQDTTGNPYASLNEFILESESDQERGWVLFGNDGFRVCFDNLFFDLVGSKRPPINNAAARRQQAGIIEEGAHPSNSSQQFSEPLL